MFEKPGDKIRSLAVLVFILYIIAGLAFCFVFWEAWGSMALLMLVGGPLAGYVTALMLDGFGAMVEATMETRDILSAKNGAAESPENKKEEQIEATTPDKEAQEELPNDKELLPGEVRCRNCGAVQRARRTRCSCCWSKLN